MTCHQVSWHDYQFGSRNRAWCYLLLRYNPISHQRYRYQLDVKGSWRVTMTCLSLMGYLNSFGCSVCFEHHCHRIEQSVTVCFGSTPCCELACWQNRAWPWLINSVVELIAVALLSSAHCHHTHVILGLITCKCTHGTGSSYKEVQRYQVVSDD